METNVYGRELLEIKHNDLDSEVKSQIKRLEMLLRRDVQILPDLRPQLEDRDIEIVTGLSENLVSLVTKAAAAFTYPDLSVNRRMLKGIIKCQENFSKALTTTITVTANLLEEAVKREPLEHLLEQLRRLQSDLSRITLPVWSYLCIAAGLTEDLELTCEAALAILQNKVMAVNNDNEDVHSKQHIDQLCQARDEQKQKVVTMKMAFEAASKDRINDLKVKIVFVNALLWNAHENLTALFDSKFEEFHQHSINHCELITRAAEEIKQEEEIALKAKIAVVEAKAALVKVGFFAKGKEILMLSDEMQKSICAALQRVEPEVASLQLKIYQFGRKTLPHKVFRLMKLASSDPINFAEGLVYVLVNTNEMASGRMEQDTAASIVEVVTKTVDQLEASTDWSVRNISASEVMTAINEKMEELKESYHQL